MQMGGGLLSSAGFSDAMMRCSTLQKRALTGAKIFAFFWLCAPTSSLGELPSPVPAAATRPSVVGRWDRIPLGTRESSVTRLLLTSDEFAWIGTSNGLAYYDGGDSVGVPPFAKPDETTVLIVNDLVEIGSGAVLVGTINGTLWRADREGLNRLVDFENRAEFSFLRRSDGRVEVASSFGLGIPDDYSKVTSVLAELKLPAHVRHEEVSRMVEIGGRLFGVGRFGTLYELYDHGRPARPVVEIKGPALHMASLGSETVVIATSDACYAVPVDAPTATIELFEGYCPAAAVTQDGELWLATKDSVFRHEAGSWTRYFGDEAVEINPVGAFASDSQGNLWVGGSHGLWRLYNHARAILLPEAQHAINSVVEDQVGSLLVGFNDGMVWRVDTSRQTTQIDVGEPMDGSAPGPIGYYPGALLSQDPHGGVWILNHNGLYRMEGSAAVREGPYPFPEAVRTQPAATFAVRDRESVYVGRKWGTEIYQLVGDQWQSVKNTLADFGGSAVPAMAYDTAGRLWVVSSHQVHLLEQGRWLDFGPYDSAPDVKKNLYGAVVSDPRADGVIANGPWGYPVLVRKQGAKYIDQPMMPAAGSAQPYLFHRLISHPTFGTLAATEKGLMRWYEEAGTWRPLTLVDPRIEAATTYLAPTGGRDLWVVANGVYQVRFPPGPAKLEMITGPVSAIRARAAQFVFRTHGFSGPPEGRLLQFDIDPPARGVENGVANARTRFTLTELSDGQTYSYRTRAIDAYGNAGQWLPGSFQVDLPWYENPFHLAGAMMAAALGLGIVLTRRGPIGFLLRVLGGKRWQLLAAEPDLEMEITQPAQNRLEFRLRAPAKQVTVEAHLQHSIDAATLGKLRKHQSNLLDALGQPQISRDNLYLLSRSLRSLGSSVYDLLPDTVRLSYEQSRPAKIRLVLEDSLMDLPWELWVHEDAVPMGVGNAAARTVLSEQLAHKKHNAGKTLTALLFAPQAEGAPPLAAAQRELQLVATRVKAWGARVVILPGNADKRMVLNGLANANLFHYVGHARFDSDDPARSHLPIAGDCISAADIHSTLERQPTPLFLAFINGCSSSRESLWCPGRNVFGLASSFLRDATYFVGTQWPVQDRFACEFADTFYQTLFPTSRRLLWDWLRNRTLTGAPLGEAIRVARERLYSKDRESAPTWSAYVCYGDPTARITLI